MTINPLTLHKFELYLGELLDWQDLVAWGT